MLTEATVVELMPMSGNRLCVHYRAEGHRDNGTNIIHGKNAATLKEGDRILVWGTGRIALNEDARRP